MVELAADPLIQMQWYLHDKFEGILEIKEGMIEDEGFTQVKKEMDSLFNLGISEYWQRDENSLETSIVVAMIDTSVDINHEDLLKNIWVNSREQLGDGIDNDRNGYIDDYYGWNFIESSNVIDKNIQDYRMELIVQALLLLNIMVLV